MNKIYILAIIFTLISQVAFALETTEKNYDWFGVKGRVRAIDRWEEKKDGYQHTIRGQFRADAWIKLSADGCVKLNARVTSGSNYNSEWIVSGLADGVESYDINVRRLYVDMKCLGKLNLEAGAMPVRTDGRLGLTDYGWVDGVRVYMKDDKRTMYLTVGEINDLKTPNVFKRKHSGVNYIQAEVTQNFGEKGHSVFVSLSDYEDTFYARVGMKYAIKKYFEWLKNWSLDYVSAEAIVSGNNKLGDHFEAAFKKENWTVRLCAYYLEPNPSDTEKENLLVKNFYGYGSNYYIEGDRRFGKDNKWVFMFRVRDGDAGKLLETGFTREFGK